MTTKYSRSTNVVKREIAGEVFLVPIKQKLADMQNLFVLHGCGEFIWDMLDESPTLPEIAESVSDSYEVSNEAASKDAEGFLSILLESELVTESA